MDVAVVTKFNSPVKIVDKTFENMRTIFWVFLADSDCMLAYRSNELFFVDLNDEDDAPN